MNEFDHIRLPWPDWKIVRRLGKGACGEVYEIERSISGFQEKAALKIISRPKDPAELEEYRNSGYDEESIMASYRDEIQSFALEYGLMKKLQGQSNIVSCDDFTVIENPDGIGGTVFIRMELLTPLPQRLKEKTMSEQDVLRLGKDIARALILCENESIVHRDIKPANILCSGFGDYKLGDFGVSRVMDHTTHATVTGTPEFMSPEVVHMDRYGHTTDIYSLGIVMYELLNNRRMPFIGADDSITPSLREAAQEKRLRGEQLPPPRDGSDALKRIILKACAYRPADRYATAQDLYDALDRSGQGSIEEEHLSDDIGETYGVFPAGKNKISDETYGVTRAGKNEYQDETIGVYGKKTQRNEEPYRQDQTVYGKTPGSSVKSTGHNKRNIGRIIAIIAAIAAAIAVVLLVLALHSNRSSSGTTDTTGVSNSTAAGADTVNDTDTQQTDAEAEEEDTDVQYETMYVVNCDDSISLRSDDSADATEITQIPFGAAVSYVSTADNGFYKIIYEGHTGYALAAYLDYTKQSASASVSDSNDTDADHSLTVSDSNDTNTNYSASVSNSNEIDTNLIDSLILSDRDRYFTNSDLDSLNQKECWYLKNGIYARYGYVFDNSELADYFGSKSWYVEDSRYNQDTISDNNKDNDPPFTDIEHSNLDFVVEYMADRFGSDM